MRHINGLQWPESPNSDPNHAFLSSIEAEIITFLSKKAVILILFALQPSYKYFNVAPLPELIVNGLRTKNGAFIRSVMVILITDLTIGPATRCDAVHPRWDVPKLLRYIRIACDVLQCIFQHVGFLLQFLEYLSHLLSDFQTVCSIVMVIP